MDINASKPEFIKDFYVRTGPGPNDLAFEDASRKPLFWDFTNTIGGTDWAKSIGSSSIHGNKGRINLAVTDGTVVPVKLPTVYWKPWIQPEWIIALERALGESAN